MATGHAQRARWGKEVRSGASAASSGDMCAALTGPESAARGSGRGPPHSAASTSSPSAAPTVAHAESSDALESVKLLIAGGFAGAVSKTATAPLARLTILYQVQGLAGSGALKGGPVPPKLSLHQAFSQIIRQEGLKALWKGNGVTIVHRLPYSAVNFWAYERSTELWTLRYPPSRDKPAQDVIRRLVCGGYAGMLACTVAYPLDLVRTRFAAQTTKRYYLGINHALRTIVRDEGVRGLYRGLGATLMQVAPSLAINYTAYGTLRSAWLDRYPPSPGVGTVPMSLACGAAAGLISSTITFPLDLVRRRMQLEGQGGQHRYTGYMDVVRTVYRMGGLRGFYAGILPEYYKVCPGVAIGFCTYELSRSAMGIASSLDFR